MIDRVWRRSSSEAVLRSGPLIGGVLLVSLAAFACGGTTTDSQGHSGELVGNWMGERSESAAYTGPLGDGLVYFLFLDASTLCIATCNPFPASPAAACNSNYGCVCEPYALQGGVMTAEGRRIAVSFEEAGDVFVGETALDGVRVKNWYRRTNALPPGAMECKPSEL